MKKLLAFLFCFSFGARCFAVLLSDIEKRAFVDFYRNTELRGALLKNQWVTVFFFDLDGDGLEEAIATDYNYQDRLGDRWHVFVQTPQSWEWAKRRVVTQHRVDPVSTLEARDNELFLLTREGHPPQLVVIHENYTLEYIGYVKYSDEKLILPSDEEHGKEELNDDEYYVIYEYGTPSVFSSVSIDEEGYLKVVEIVRFLQKNQTEALDELLGEGHYTLEPINPVTYTKVPTVKPEERTQLINPETPQPIAPEKIEMEVAFETSEAEDVLALPQNVKPTFIKKWLPVFVVVVLYTVWRVTRQRFQNKTRHPQPPAI